IRRWRAEVRVVRDIEEVGPELELPPLGFQRETLLEGEIPVPASRPDDYVPAGVAVRADRVAPERRRIEPLRHLIVGRAAAGKRWISDQVWPVAANASQRDVAARCHREWIPALKCIDPRNPPAAERLFEQRIPVLEKWKLVHVREYCHLLAIELAQ